jgi:PIN domain nuclease of toxin-antitoxin system
VSLLLDTQVVLWVLTGNQRKVSATARAAINAAETAGSVSIATIWEAAIKRALGRLPDSAGLADAIERSEIELLPITARHADHVATLPRHHGDPFDRLLIAQAQLEGMTLVSSDPVMARYDVDVLW